MKLLITSGLLLVCVASSLALASKPLLKKSSPYAPQSAQDRDDIGHIGGGGGGGYGPPPVGPSYAEEPAKDTGYYYYYYPVVPEGGGKKKGGLFSGSKGFFGKMMETIMYPFLYPIMRAYDYFDGRSLQARASEYLPVELFDKITTMIQEEIYKEECLSRMICKVSEFFIPEDYQTHLKTFKDSAKKKTDCNLDYKCSSFDPTQKL
ncbi:hypothetical protein Anas_07672 [Armadillidium nasatum]|uniref:Uncharacterized protein n=2 Tax=Armadillidium nasatum TaxID=96803 RepID=A0A5N5SLK5_9CRUS|nr:hypothetical protein Anas_07672 [Armadillidium nasatum]